MLFFGLATSPAPPQTIYVSTAGSDTNSGTKRLPLRTVDGARRAAQKIKNREIVVKIASGTYRLDKPVVFGPKDSPNATYRAAEGAKVVLSGSTEFHPNWTKHTDKIVKCRVPANFIGDQIYINGKRQILARYPNEDPSIRIFHGYAKDAASKERVGGWKNPEGGFFHAMHVHLWGDFHYQIQGKTESAELKMEGGWQNNRRLGPHQEYRFVEGIQEELDSPGEWFFDKTERTLYWYPTPRVNLNHTTVEGVSLRSLMEFRGAKGIKLNGLTFQHTARTFMENREPLLRSDWTTYRGGAVYFKGAEDCSVEDSVFEDLGGNAVFVDGKNRGVVIRRCRIENVGANGVAFVGDPKAVRNPLFEYGERLSSDRLDMKPGPKTDDYPKNCIVEDCLITRTGRVEKQTAGVQISMAHKITVRDCSIYEVPRAGINIGDGCWGGHLIEGCDVFDTVLETGDHGSFNSWGRDRYWGLTDVDMNKGERPELSALDMIDPVTIQNNRWRCDHGWDIDLDDGSSHYIIRNNLCLNGGLKNREGFDRLVENNIIVGNSFHPHVWFLNSGDVFRKNIVFTRYQPIQVRKPWGKFVDFNLLQEVAQAKPTTATELQSQSGRDENSLRGDALFVAPERGDYRLRPGSPGLMLGFKNFAMDQFGVKTPRLRAIAKSPKLPSGSIAARETIPTYEWHGAQVKDLVDPGEVSATGYSAGRGVLVVSVKPKTLSKTLGLKPMDVITTVGNRRIMNVKELKASSGNPKHITVWRDQHSVELGG